MKAINRIIAILLCFVTIISSLSTSLVAYATDIVSQIDAAATQIRASRYSQMCYTSHFFE